MNKVIRLIVVGLMALSSAECLEWTPEAKEGYEEAMRSVEEHRLLPPEVLENPVNREWVKKLREDAVKGDPGGLGSVLFLNLGDPEVMPHCLEIYAAKRGMWTVFLP